MKSIKFTFTTLLFLFILNCNAAKDFMKYGKMTIEEYNDTSFAYDTTAEAIVLGEFGSLTFSGNYGTLLEMHVRLKILKESAFDRANIKLKIHKNEIYHKIKGYVYNVVNNELVAEKVDNDSYHTNMLENGFFEATLTFPNIRVGSVIEYTYMTEVGNYYNLANWYFQQSIPVKRSDYWVSVPNGIEYKFIQQGYETVEFETTYKEQGHTTYHWSAKNVPEYKTESYVDNIENYLTKVEFELERIAVPSIPIISNLLTYSDFFEKLQDNEKFGKAIKKTRFLDKEVDKILSSDSNMSDVSKLEEIFRFVSTKVKWNGKSTMYSSFGTKKSYEQGIGSVSDINFMLIAMLEKAGFNVYPLILSTRNHGKLHPFIAMESRFNYVIAYVKIEENEYLLDATEPEIEFGQLPARCMNGRGIVVHPKVEKWVNLLQKEHYETNTKINFSFDNQSEVLGNVLIQKGGYNSLDIRNEIKKSNKEEYLKNYKKNNSELEISELSMTNISELDQKINIEYKGNFSSYADFFGDKIIFNPVVWAKDESPFKNEKRTFPINFTCPINETYMVSFDIPEGYKIDQMPENTMVMLPDNSGRYIYSISQTGNKISLMYRCNITKVEYLPSEYPYIKEFFERIQIAEKQQIVMSKGE